MPVPSFRFRFSRLSILAALLAGAGCSQPNPSAPTVQPFTVPVVVETYTDTLPVAGAKFYSFSTTLNGNISLTLLSLTENGAPASDSVGIAIGQPQATDCTIIQNATAAPGTTAQVSVTEPPGVYCARVYDLSTLTTPATFSLNIAHPR